MNQILETNSKKTKLKKLKNNFKMFKIQLIFSTSILAILLFFCIYYIFSLRCALPPTFLMGIISEQSLILDTSVSNYEIYKLYSDIGYNSVSNSNEQSFQDEGNIFGIIKIPKINIEYSVFSKLTEEQLKISPCKFFGGSPKDNGNICIAGHNYDNSLFFSNLKLLDENDEIFIYDNLDNEYIYKVFSIYETDENDLSPIFNYEKNSKTLTLITCNNFNKKRIVVKAKM